MGHIITIFQTEVATGHWNRLVVNKKRGLIHLRTAGTVLLSPYDQRCLLAPFKHMDCALSTCWGACHSPLYLLSAYCMPGSLTLN